MAALIAFALVAGLVIVVVMWPLCLVGHAIHLTPSWHQLWNRDHVWMHEHYPLVGLRFVGTAVLLLAAAAAASVPVVRAVERERVAQQRDQAEAHQAWLEDPPPPLMLPARFTQAWIATNVPNLHPGQIPKLMRELKARGWSEARIAERVTPYMPAA